MRLISQVPKLAYGQPTWLCVLLPFESRPFWLCEDDIVHICPLFVGKGFWKLFLCCLAYHLYCEQPSWEKYLRVKKLPYSNTDLIIQIEIFPG